MPRPLQAADVLRSEAQFEGPAAEGRALAQQQHQHAEQHQADNMNTPTLISNRFWLISKFDAGRSETPSMNCFTTGPAS